MSKTIKLELFRASEKDPLALPGKMDYGGQYGLYKEADWLKPKHAQGRLGSVFAGLTREEARQWGDKIWKLEAEVPYKHANAYDVTKWTELVEYYLLHAAENTPEVKARVQQLIREYWASQRPVQEILDEVVADSGAQGRWEVLLAPEWVAGIEELGGENREVAREVRLNRK